ncbi:hypothetical protein DFS34DRAFT_588790 [Phlyctochytrium arcticum]|nr:hypothetical protein DFS34DRAFT_588790 [Phlyctochytrium arcticum]
MQVEAENVSAVPIQETLNISNNLNGYHFSLTYSHRFADPNPFMVRAVLLPFVLALQFVVNGKNEQTWMRCFGDYLKFMGKPVPPLERAYKYYRATSGRNKWTINYDLFYTILMSPRRRDVRLRKEEQEIYDIAQISIEDWKVSADVIGENGAATIQTLERCRFNKLTPEQKPECRVLIFDFIDCIETDDDELTSADCFRTPSEVTISQRVRARAAPRRTGLGRVAGVGGKDSSHNSPKRRRAIGDCNRTTSAQDSNEGSNVMHKRDSQQISPMRNLSNRPKRFANQNEDIRNEESEEGPRTKRPRSRGNCDKIPSALPSPKSSYSPRSPGHIAEISDNGGPRRQPSRNAKRVPSSPIDADEA